MKNSIQQFAIPFSSDNNFSFLIEAIGDAKIVLLGEASHGTSEFYTIRAQLTKQLIKEKGFSIIAVEGDWPPCFRVNQYLKGFDDMNINVREVLKAFNRWPTWMWANEEIVEFISWLKLHNDTLEIGHKVGFYGLDLYSLFESTNEIVQQIKKQNLDSTLLDQANRVHACFEPYNEMPEHYALATAHFSHDCMNEVGELFSSIESNNNLNPSDQEQDLHLIMNALVVKNAEKYYRTSIQDDAESWNVRDEHMVEAINRISNYFDVKKKIIIWEHNTHIGDARATTMVDEGMLNVGQLLRQQNKYGDVFAVGFGTHHGSVIAADKWGVPFEKMSVPPARKDSWEDVLQQAGAFDKYLIFNDGNREHFTEWTGHRAIGVVYNPDYEHLGNYVPTRISYRYDAFIYIEETKALKPLII